MPDLLTHVLGAYVIGTLLTWRGWLQPRHVAVLMVGAVVPDLAKIRLLVDASLVEGLLGEPWLWTGIHRAGPALILAGVGALCFERGRRWTAFGLLGAGVGLHLLFDLAVMRAAGIAPPYLYPVSWWEPPSADLLLSSDPWPWLLSVALAACVWWYDRERSAG